MSIFVTSFEWYSLTNLTLKLKYMIYIDTDFVRSSSGGVDLMFVIKKLNGDVLGTI